MRERVALGVSLVLLFALSACGGSPPAGPTPAAPKPVTALTLSVVTIDTVSRDLPGVTLTILDGPQAGTSGTTNANGFFAFSFPPTLAGQVTVRATKDGYTPQTAHIGLPTTLPAGYVISLAPAAGNLPITAGTYAITFASDPACTALRAGPQIPDDLLTRTYTATITPSAYQPEFFFVGVSDPSVTAEYPEGPTPAFGFGLGVAGNVVGFTIDDPLAEVLPSGQGQLEIWGGAPTGVPPTVSGPTITIPFSGNFQYVSATASQGGTCESSNDTLILTLESAASPTVHLRGRARL